MEERPDTFPRLCVDLSLGDKVQNRDRKTNLMKAGELIDEVRYTYTETNPVTTLLLDIQLKLAVLCEALK